MGVLTQMIDESGDLTSLSKPDQAIYITMARQFETSTQYLFLEPEELYQSTGMASADVWQKFLQLQVVQNFIKGQMSFISQISQRKTFKALVELALSGNQQAAKQVQELSGVLNQQDANRVIVLHQIPRPNKNTTTQEENTHA